MSRGPAYRRPWRLQVGDLQLVPAVSLRNKVRGEAHWALPGGATATFVEVMQWARRLGLPRPMVLYEEGARFPEKRKGAA